MTIHEKLAAIQQGLQAPKSQYNSFGGYNYRSCEDVLTAVKPLLSENKCVLTLDDSIVEVGGRVYVKATATLTDANNLPGPSSISVTAYAREEETKKGMDASQVTGAASSYARKYALNGLFCIDDAKDSDATNTHGQEKPQQKRENRPVSEDSPFALTCVDCGAKINDAERDWSVRKYGRPLCRNCQKKA